jgi:hypothetical protein
MANIASEYSGNVFGKFYVDDLCNDCDLWGPRIPRLT